VRLERILFDVYAGLIRIGYTRTGAIDALQVLGIAEDEAIRVATTYEGGTDA